MLNTWRKVAMCLLPLGLAMACASTPPDPQTNDRAGQAGEASLDLTESPCPAIDEVVPEPDTLAEMIYYHNPTYPRLAVKHGLQGEVVIKSLIGSRGTVLNAVVYGSSGKRALDQAALEAAPKCRFKPAIRHGQPVCMWVTYKVEFIVSATN